MMTMGSQSKQNCEGKLTKVGILGKKWGNKTLNKID